ncbi:MAG: hypothetical protein IJF83_00095 [Methanobrevibacter sp.]|nr:hypothetical protein [Methanobrevibacter sp.]
MSVTIPDYFTEDQKMVRMKRQPWNHDEYYQIHNILWEKGYLVNCVVRMGADGKWHDAWQIEREDTPTLIEMLFRQRIPVEVQAEGHGKASINFVYDTRADQILECLPRFFKNPRGK